MIRRSLLLLSLPALALAGCSGTVNRGLDSVHQPVVSRTDYTFDVGTDGAGLSPGEAARLAGWMRSLRLRYGDRVSIDDPAGDPAAREAIGAEVARFGLLLADTAPVTGAPVAAGTARVVVNRAVAFVPHCPDYSRNGSHEFAGSTTSNFGCAANSDLAAMVADPADLVRGEPGSGTIDTATSSRAIDAYRKAAPTGGGGTTMKTESAGGSGGGK
ncbi:CpaD family pilus assembly protein [Sphingomonas bacterium]|uniref:CpaD family pilus assembly protein n=1 Tax=Sphingomonas bacterium TaxID=1895847 RepID=UPI0020C64A5F|nr:CpaD family pilus assembly protein [Sphingomonas bacterium]